MLEQYLTHLPKILAAPKDNAPIKRLVYRPDFGAREFSDALTLDPELGVIGDRWRKKAWLRLDNGAPDPRVQVSILPKRVHDMLRDFHPDAPDPGDPIIADFDMSEENLPIGAHLRIGEVELEVSDVPNYGCEKWAARYGNDALKFIAAPERQKYRLRGVLCRIIKGGRLHVSDPIKRV